MEPKEITLTSIQDRNLQDLPDPTVSAHYTTMYLARVSIKGQKQSGKSEKITRHNYRRHWPEHP